MNRLIYALPLCVFLVACDTLPKVEEKIVTKTEYIVRIPPAQSLTIPPKVYPPKNLDAATQRDVAHYINELDGRNTKLENQLIEIAKFFDDEKKKLEAEALKKNQPAK